MEPLLVLSLWTAQIVGGGVPRGAIAPPRPAPVHRRAPVRNYLPRGGYGGWWPWSGSAQVLREEPRQTSEERSIPENQRIQSLVVTSPAYQPETAKPAMKEYPNLPPPVPFTASSQTPPAESR